MVKKSSNPEKNFRSFTIEGSSIGFEGGSYISSVPSGAAKKVGRKLFSLVEKDPSYTKFKGDKVMQFILRETTQGSAHKTFPYDAHKIKLAKPVQLPWKNSKGEPLTVEYSYKVFALKEHEVHSALQSKLQNS